MKKKPLETAATIVLGVVCAGLIFHLAIRVRDVHAGAPPISTPDVRSPRHTVTDASSRDVRTVRAASVASAGRADSNPKGPVLNLALYQELQSQALHTPDRDPFSFEPTPQQLQQARRARDVQIAASAAAPGPPPPPPIPFQAVGYSVKAQGQLEAYLADTQQVYVVHMGGEFDKRYRVVMITPAMIEIEDESLHRTVELPFPQ
ncbi:MAG: hypothetical protein ACRD18_14845 [Terriglobia bacterium]